MIRDGHTLSAGLHAALADRYVIYCLLLVALEYIGFLRVQVPLQIDSHSKWRAPLVVASLASIALCVYSDVAAYRQLKLRKNQMITHLILWERHPGLMVLSPDEDSMYREANWIPVRLRFQQELTREIALGLYIPPYSASDPLPIRTHSLATSGIEDEAPPAKNNGYRDAPIL